MTEHRSPDPPGATGITCYAAGSLGTGVYSTVPTLLLLYFCTEVLHVPPSDAAAIVLVPKIWSIVWDPFVGAWSDRTSTRFGRRRPFIAAGTIGVVVSFVALFSPPPLSLTALVLWTGIAYFALSTLYSLFAVPYVALPAELGGDEHSRARLVATRMTVSMLGALAGAGIAPLLIAAGGSGRPGYASMSRVIAIICLVAMSSPLLMLRGRDVKRPRAPGGAPRLSGELFTALRDRTFQRYGVSYLLQLAAVGTLTSAVPYLVTHCFGRPEADTGAAMFAMLGCTALSIPAWSWAGRALGNERALRAGLVTFAFSGFGIGMLAIAAAQWLYALALFAILGIAFGAMQVLPFTVVAHLARQASDRGHAVEGSYTGVWTAIEKLGLALGPAVTAGALWLAGRPTVHTLGMLAGLALPLLALAALVLLGVGRHAWASTEKAA